MLAAPNTLFFLPWLACEPRSAREDRARPSGDTLSIMYVYSIIVYCTNVVLFIVAFVCCCVSVLLCVSLCVYCAAVLCLSLRVWCAVHCMCLYVREQLMRSYVLLHAIVSINP